MLRVFLPYLLFSFLFQVYNFGLQNFINRLFQFLTSETTKSLLFFSLCIKKNNLKLAFSPQKIKMFEEIKKKKIIQKSENFFKSYEKWKGI
jgi:hypothetical protein